MNELTTLKVENLTVVDSNLKLKSGKFIRATDLVDWLQWHLRNRPVGSIHADIQKALKEFDV